jgi:hypothetical protein
MKQALRFTFGDNDYRIFFRYSKNFEAWEESVRKNALYLSVKFFMVNWRQDSLKQNNVTTCEIVSGPKDCSTKEMKPFAKGVAYRSVMDNFCKETGRKAALTNALGLIKLAELKCDYGKFWSTIKAFKTEAWKSYFSRREVPAVLAVPD